MASTIAVHWTSNRHQGYQENYDEGYEDQIKDRNSSISKSYNLSADFNSLEILDA